MSPVSSTTVVPVSSPIRCRTVWVLPTPGRAVEQQPALEVLAGLAQPVAVAGDADDLAADVGEGVVRQDQRLAGHRLPARGSAAPTRARRTSSGRTTPPGRGRRCGARLSCAQLAPRPAARPRVGRRRSRPDTLRRSSSASEPRNSSGDLGVAVLGEHHDGAVALAGLVRPGRPGTVTRATLPGRGPLKPSGSLAGDQLGDAERAAVAVAGHADDLVVALGQPGVERGLDVDVLVGRPLLLGDRQVLGRAPRGSRAMIAAERRAARPRAPAAPSG